MASVSALPDSRLANLDASISSRLSSAGKTVQSGVVSSPVWVAGGLTGKYVDVTIAAVASVDRAIVIVEPVYVNPGTAGEIGGTGYLTSTTNIRIEGPTNASGFICRWKVVELY